MGDGKAHEHEFFSSLLEQFCLTLAAQEHSTSELRNHGLPPVVRLLLFLPGCDCFQGIVRPWR
jgi:hypothetical protein